ncbi:uncharacterized protein LOC142497447 isoform X2 [Ascaphus truei]|uniref:uncharacterized protein LOC142497447 isoform X2 n=1 Tax=Ascaphus truei TaxID=8439 RepID=UPI003F59F9F0
MLMERVSLTMKKLIFTGWFWNDGEWLKLVNGPSICSGRVEVFHDNQWGSVCDDFWDSRNAQVVCTQLHCGIALSGPGNARFGEGSGPIWLDDVKCTGRELLLSECILNQWGISNCYHREDASAVCSEHLPKPTISIFTSNSSHDAGQELQLNCTVPKLYFNCTVYIIEVHSNRTLAKLPLSAPDNVIRYNINASLETLKYTCQYEVTVKNISFMSPLSDPVDGIQNPPTVTPPSGDGVQNSPTVTPPSGDVTDNGKSNATYEEGGPQNTEVPVVTAVTLVVVLILLLLVFLIVFIAYKRKHSQTEREPAPGNEYEGSATETCTDLKTNTKEKGTADSSTDIVNIPSGEPDTATDAKNKENIYEFILLPNPDSNSGPYESTINFEEHEETYEVLNEDTISTDMYETLRPV